MVARQSLDLTTSTPRTSTTDTHYDHKGNQKTILRNEKFSGPKQNMKTKDQIELAQRGTEGRNLTTRTVVASLALAVGAAIGVAGAALAQHPKEITVPEKSSVAPAAEGPRRAALGETVTKLADQPIPNIPGKRLVVDAVDYVPGGYSAAHRHAGSAFIYAYVVSGEVRSQVNDEPVRVYKAGEQWFENPGSHHRVSENASATTRARLIAVIIVDATEKELTSPEKGKE
jgi:quercetin dioxygenase-like cupin family protein